jgi:hypothetical protein
MSCAACLIQLHKFTVACVACNWILVAKPKISSSVGVLQHTKYGCRYIDKTFSITKHEHF